MRLIIRKTLLMFLLLSLSNVLTGFQLSAQEQNKKFSVKADNVTLKEAIEVVRKQGNYSFLIRNNDIDLNKKVSVNVNKGTINDVMAQLLTGTGISYEVNGNRVVIFHAAVPEKEQGKAFVLKGKVTDPSGEGSDWRECESAEFYGRYDYGYGWKLFSVGDSECTIIRVLYRICYAGSRCQKSDSFTHCSERRQPSD